VKDLFWTIRRCLTMSLAHFEISPGARHDLHGQDITGTGVRYPSTAVQPLSMRCGVCRGGELDRQGFCPRR